MPTWGAYDGHIRAGYTLSRSTTSAAAAVTPYVGTDGWDYDDDQRCTVTVDGDALTPQTKHNGLTGTHNHQASGSTKQMAFSVKNITGDPGETITVRIEIDQSYIATETPFVEFSFKLANVPSKPATPTVTGVTQSQATVNMALPSSNYSPIVSTDYRIYTAATGGSLVASYTSLSAALSHTFAGLSPSTTYYAEVDANNGMGDGVNSDRKSFTTGAVIAPSKPTAPVASSIGDTTVTLTGSAPTTNGATITTVRMQVRKPDDTVVYDDEPGYVDADYVRNVTTLVIGNSYKARYLVNSNNGPSEWSDDTPFSTTAAEPEAPTNLAVAAVVGGTQFSWDPPASDGGDPITQYGLEVYSDEDYTVLEFSQLSADSPVLVDPGDLPTGTQLWWRVRAENGEGWGEYALGAPFYLATDGGIYYYPPEGGPAVRGYMYWFNEDGVPVLVM